MSWGWPGCLKKTVCKSLTVLNSDTVQSFDLNHVVPWLEPAHPGRASLSHRTPHLEGLHVWFNALLSLSWDSSPFLREKPHIFIFHWAHQLHSQSCSRTQLLGHQLSHRLTPYHLCERLLAPLWLLHRALHQGNAGIRLKYTFIRNSSCMKTGGSSVVTQHPSWLHCFHLF